MTGGVHSITGSETLNARFPGQWFQVESGLHYNWHRHYDPTIGRYTQPDPLGFVDGPSVYAYAGNAPGEAVDPDGQNSVTIGGTIGQGIGTFTPIPGGALIGRGIGMAAGAAIMCMARPKVGSCSCQHRDIFSSGGQSCQTLREQGVCTGPYKGTGSGSAACQANARENAPAGCRGCLGHCLYTPG